MGNVGKVEEMLADPNFDPSENDCRALGTASGFNQLVILNLLLMNPRSYPSAESVNRAFNIACWEGHIEIVNRLLQDERVNPSARNNRAIITAHSRGHQAVVDRLRQDPRVGYNVEV
jgi:hypothetical protein